MRCYHAWPCKSVFCEYRFEALSHNFTKLFCCLVCFLPLLSYLWSLYTSSFHWCTYRRAWVHFHTSLPHPFQKLILPLFLFWHTHSLLLCISLCCFHFSVSKVFSKLCTLPSSFLRIWHCTMWLLLLTFILWYLPFHTFVILPWGYFIFHLYCLPLVIALQCILSKYFQKSCII